MAMDHEGFAHRELDSSSQGPAGEAGIDFASDMAGSMEELIAVQEEFRRSVCGTPGESQEMESDVKRRASWLTPVQ